MRLIGVAAMAGVLAACGSEVPAPDPAARPEAPPGTAIAARAAQGGPESRAFRDWRAVCDNGGRCAAHAGSDTSGWLMVRMDAGPNARPEILADLPEIGGVAIRLFIDGRSHALVRASGEGGGHAVPTEATSTILARLAAAREIRLVAPAFEATIPAAGISATMLWIDERQGRLGTTTALVRRGDRPPSTVPEAPALPTVTAAPSVSQAGFGDSAQTLPAALEALPAVQGCRSGTGQTAWVQKEVRSARLDATTELWAVPCFTGAYNIGHEWFVTGPGGSNPRAALLPSSSGATDGETINGAFAPGTRTLTAFAKGRGIGDCGIVQAWTWTGREFVLTHEAEMQDCDGIPASLWPTTWRTRGR